MERDRKTRKINQQCSPLPKRKRVDAQGNNRLRIFGKTGTATFLFAEGFTKPAGEVFLQQMRENAKRLGGKIVCDFINGK